MDNAEDGNSMKITNQSTLIKASTAILKHYTGSNISTSGISSYTSLKSYHGNLLISQPIEIFIPSSKVFDSGAISSTSTSGSTESSQNLPLKKLESRTKVGLAIICLVAEEVETFIQPNAVLRRILWDRSTNFQARRGHHFTQEFPCVFDASRVPLFHKYLNDSRVLQPLIICSNHGKMGFLPLQEIQNTDFHTSRTTYCPIPQVTHVHNRCVLEFPQNHLNKSTGRKEKHSDSSLPQRVNSRLHGAYTAANYKFLKVCEGCNEPLVAGNDIYIYRGESSFCSKQCRYWKIKLEGGLARATRIANKSMATVLPSENEKVIFYVEDIPLSS